MSIGLLVLGALALVLLAILLVRAPAKLPLAMQQFVKQGQPLLLRLPIAIVAASLIGQLLPENLIASGLGPGTGATGILLACAIGAVLPGGPYVSFPLALLIWQGGAGAPQMVAMLTSWSVFAVHRIMAYELPLLGPRFVGIRLLSSGLLPPIAGLLALIVLLVGLAHDRMEAAAPAADRAALSRSGQTATQAERTAISPVTGARPAL